MIRIAIAATTLALVAQANPPSAPNLQISHRARAVAPGEVVIVDVRPRTAVSEVRADWLGQTLVFFQVEPSAWRGIAPIDVGAKAGRHTLKVSARTADGRALEQAYAITIAPRTFPARRITVDPKFVDPPPDAL